MKQLEDKVAVSSAGMSALRINSRMREKDKRQGRWSLLLESGWCKANDLRVSGKSPEGAAAVPLLTFFEAVRRMSRLIGMGSAVMALCVL